MVDVEQFDAGCPRDCVVLGETIHCGVRTDGDFDAVGRALEQVLVNIACAVCFALGLVEFVR